MLYFLCVLSNIDLSPNNIIQSDIIRVNTVKIVEIFIILDFLLIFNPIKMDKMINTASLMYPNILFILFFVDFSGPLSISSFKYINIEGIIFSFVLKK